MLHLLLAALLLGDYRAVNGLRMYYEVHGRGPPLLLLHGGTATVATSWGNHIPYFARSRRVIAPEQIGHGHTRDAEGPYTYARMADDTAALLQQLGVDRADVYGMSDGGVVGLYLAARHPGRVRKLVVAGAAFAHRDPLRMARWVDSVTPASWPADDVYKRVSPDGAKHWPVFLGKVLAMYKTWTGLTPAEIAAIRAPTMIVIGDRDEVSVEQAAQMRKALPGSRLAVLPDTNHGKLHRRGDWLNPMITEFLDEPFPSP
jgi:pimeloyl-ACP methyl ester carboxylesterase